MLLLAREAQASVERDAMLARFQGDTLSDEPLAKVEPFVEEQAEKMEYVVACDEARKTSEGYMKAYGQNGIPTAFIVGKEEETDWVRPPFAYDPAVATGPIVTTTVDVLGILIYFSVASTFIGV